MEKPIRILHIDQDYKITYLIRLPGTLIHSPIPLKKAIQLLKTENFDLILAEPLNKAILNPQDEKDFIYSETGTLRKEMKRVAAI